MPDLRGTALTAAATAGWGGAGEVGGSVRLRLLHRPFWLQVFGIMTLQLLLIRSILPPLELLPAEAGGGALLGASPAGRPRRITQYNTSSARRKS